jgi:hypothetical protein
VSANRGDPLAKLAEELGRDLPAFDGPLQAFDMAPVSEKGTTRTIYLGGDLHAVHPDTREHRPRPEHDASLEAATVALDDLEHESVETVAVAGIWCLLLRGDQVDSAPYFSLWDTDGRLRTWLLLPPARLMIGIGQFWLPSVPPPRSPDTGKVSP